MADRLKFDELCDYRHRLQDFCRLHLPSLECFRDGVNFRSRGPAKDPNRLRLTSSATCLSSILVDCPDIFKSGKGSAYEDLAKKFVARALDTNPEKWKSEGSAPVYCRCRALPLIFHILPELDVKVQQVRRPQALSHLDFILKQMDRDPKRPAIGETDVKNDPKRGYPPNAFHTYWALSLITQAETVFPNVLSKEKLSELESKKHKMTLWAREKLGFQVSLHSADSSMLDTDELAWCLAVVTRFGDYLQSDLTEQDFIRQAVKCLFSTQLEVGTWRHYKPLFHYRDAGNAYCYVYETFNVLLSNTLRPDRTSTFLRAAYKENLSGLLRLWKYAVDTQTVLEPTSGGDPAAVGWSSGHKQNSPNPESWATASVFSFAQALRRLVGLWVSEDASSSLSVKKTSLSTKEAEEKIETRGRTWSNSPAPATDLLFSLFINPQRMRVRDDSRLEPDLQPIEDRHARGAILFGPPGTSKTTLVKTLAACLGWTYVEIHASHFVSEGLPNVQSTADALFKKLMELDHAVILFDEIDELVRSRDEESDAFGRFLTTSMLPKLAELWQLRKVMYFIATNHIKYFDNAVTRSERFDAVILVSPPDFDTKMLELRRRLAQLGVSLRIRIRREQIDAALKKVRAAKTKGEKADDEEPLFGDEVLAKFLLLRFDEISELAHHLAGLATNHVVSLSKDTLIKALRRITDGRVRKRKHYIEYRQADQFARRDFTKVGIWRISSGANLTKSGLVERKGNENWLCAYKNRPSDVSLPAVRIASKPNGRVEIRRVKMK